MAGLTRRRLLHGLAASAAAGALVRPAHGQSPTPAPSLDPVPSLADIGDAPRAAMAGAALALLGALPAETRRHAVFSVGDKERLDWHYIPRRRAGVPFKDMPAAGRAAAHELMKASLSAVGYGKAVGIIRLEEVLRRLETFGLMGARTTTPSPSSAIQARRPRGAGGSRAITSRSTSRSCRAGRSR